MVNHDIIAPRGLDPDGLALQIDLARDVPVDILNHGRIEGDIEFVSQAVFRNPGEIIGDVEMAGRYQGKRGLLGGNFTGSDGPDRFLLNTATVTGDIDAGAGDDILDLRGAVVSGTITGGPGNHRVIVSPESPHFEGGGGRDSVWSYGAYDLGPRIADLRVMEGGHYRGTGNDAGSRIYGNSGDNILSRRGGSDRLYGKGGDDVLRDGDADSIKDYQPGTDTVDLRAWALSGTGDLVSRQLAPDVLELRVGAERFVVDADGTAFGVDELIADLLV